jgi:HlyD family secretion protein
MGNGIVLPQGGRIVEVQARGNGVLTALSVGVGARVEAGQVVATLGETDGERDAVSLRAQIAERERDVAATEASADSEQRARAESLRRQIQAIDLRLQTARAQEQVLRDRLATNESLYGEHLVTRGQVIQAQNDLAAVRQELSNATSDRARLGEQDLDLQRASDDRLRDQRNALSELRRRLDALTASLADVLAIRAPDAGTVVEARAQPGALIRTGQAVLGLEQRGSGLELVSFVNAQDGKRIHAGMPVRIALASARREEYGTLEGIVASVSEFPLSLEAVRAIIQNEELARSFVQSGPPFMARVRLLPDPDSLSGYKWTSRRGATLAMSSGIPASVEIVTELRRPIAMVSPAMRDLLGL